MSETTKRNWIPVGVGASGMLLALALPLVASLLVDHSLATHTVDGDAIGYGEWAAWIVGVLAWIVGIASAIADIVLARRATLPLWPGIVLLVCALLVPGTWALEVFSWVATAAMNMRDF